MQFIVGVWDTLRKELASDGHCLVPIEKNLIDAIWDDAPHRPYNPVMIQPVQFTGKNWSAITSFFFWKCVLSTFICLNIGYFILLTLLYTILHFSLACCVYENYMLLMNEIQKCTRSVLHYNVTRLRYKYHWVLNC